jgi:hypothetical protein
VYLFPDAKKFKSDQLAFRARPLTAYMTRNGATGSLLTLATLGRAESGHEPTFDEMIEEAFPDICDWPENHFCVNGKLLPTPEKWRTVLQADATPVSANFIKSPAKKRSFLDMVSIKTEPVSPAAKKPLFEPKK